MNASQTIAGRRGCAPSHATARPPLVYALHSGNLYGTERMALAAARCLADRFQPVIFAPPGPVLGEAAGLGFDIRAFTSPATLVRKLRPYLARHRRLGFVATGVMHSLACLGLNSLYRREVRHLHLVHGGTDERDSYGRKRYLNAAPLRFVAVSDFVRERLVAHGVDAGRVSVIENFLPDERIAELDRADRRPGSGVRRVVVIARLDPIKRVDLLLDALEREPRLGDLSVRVLGSGWQAEELEKRAAAMHPGVEFLGFRSDVGAELARADLLVHTCPAEPFGLAILEAMAAGVPVLAPDRGGAGALIEDGRTGFHFAADDAQRLAARLVELRSMDPSTLAGVVAAARGTLATRFSARERAADYARLLEGEQG